MSRRRKLIDSTPFDTIRLEGNIFVPELLERAARGEAAHQKEADYAVPKGLKLHDEYGRAFRIASAVWQDFATHVPRTDLDSAKLTTGFVLDILRQCLGYADLALLQVPVQIGDRGFPVTATAIGGRLAVIIAPHTVALDEPASHFAIHGSGAKRKSAHQLAQEFLNASRDSVWAIVTNGRTLRLLRDAETLTRPNFLEFDLETILRESEARYADFSALWRILHASRAGAATALPTDCIWEKWKSEGHAQGLRVRDGLRDGVTQALLILGRGYLAHPDNTALRQRLHYGELTKEAYFQQLLRLIYRSLFLFCAEERDLLHTPDAQPAARKAYAEGYSLRRLRNRSLRHTAHDSHGDLWLSLRIVFRALASGQPRLALPALGGLFAETQCPDLDSASLANRDLLAAMRHLRWSSASGSLTAIDYRNMGPEELGSVYESLLELVPQLDLPARTFGFAGITDTASTSGNARKTTGSYYTPDSLVQELIKSALDPVIADRLAAQPDRPVEALLSITVCDPSCGSGHFLLAAARRLAEKLAELRAPDGAVRPDDYRHALREVIARCIHGVDRNPLALELARTVLWLEGVDPGLPLSFLEHHLVCGDALLGLTDLRQLENGIPDAAFTALSGDDKKLCTDLKKQNKAARKQLDDLRSGQDLLAPPGQPDALSEFSALESLPEATPEEIAAKEAAWLAFLTHTRESPLARAADVFVGAFLAPKPTGSTPPDTRALAAALFPAKATPELTTQIQHARHLCDRDHANVLHWPLAFPKVFARGGFDCILGNPPWERIKLQEEEFFATREPLIATAKNKAERAKRIQWLSEGSLRYHLSQFQSPATPDPAEIQLFRDFEMEKRLAEASSIFAHVDGKEGGRYPLTGVGDVNTYALFSETIANLTTTAGRAGFIVPMGIATDDTTKAFFASLIAQKRLAQLIGLFEIRAWFPATDDRKAFCLLTLGKADKSRFIFDVKTIEDLQQDAKWIELPPEDLILINPNTRTCPIFRARADAELTRAIYRRVPVLIEEARDGQPEKNPWDIRFGTMFHMSNDSHLFEDNAGPDLVPLYEAKMIHQFDHRWASYNRTTEGELDTADVTDADKAEPSFTVTPRYWVPRSAVEYALLSKQDPLYPLHWAAQGKRRDQLAWWFRCWLWGHELLAGRKESAARLRQEMDDTRIVSHDTMEIVMAHEPERQWAERTATTHPLSADEQTMLWNQSKDDDGLISRDSRKLGGKSSDELSEEWEHLADAILTKRRRQWVMGWRRNARNTDERSMIAAVTPAYGIGDSIFLLTTSEAAYLSTALLANCNTIAFDFVMRQKLAGSNLSFYYIKQLPILPPDAYTEADLAYIVPRVLELTYTAHDMRPWAEDVISSYQRQFPQHPPLVPDPAHPQPYRFDPDRRAQLRADLDARYARLYGLTRDELRYILDPADTHGPDYPTETFRVLKTNELKQFGEYRTRRLVLEAWDREEALDTESHKSNLRNLSPAIARGEGLNSFLIYPPGDRLKFSDTPSGRTFLARLSQAENDIPAEDGQPRSFLRFEAFSEAWFLENLPPQGEVPWADTEAFLRYYADAAIYGLEVETISSHGERFPFLSTIRNQTAEGIEPTNWFRIRVGGARRDDAIADVVPLQLFQNLLTEGTALTLGDIEPVDQATQSQLDRAVSTQHIASAGAADLQRVLKDVVSHQIDWAVVYDVGQGNAIGLHDCLGIVRCYVDLGGGSGPNNHTFPTALKSFCFTVSPPIILTHWDEDHWSSGVRDRRALARHWIAPRQHLGVKQVAFIAAIITAGGRVIFVDAGMPAIQIGQLYLELCTGRGRNHSGISVTLCEAVDIAPRRMLFPGDADYRYIPSVRNQDYLSVVVPHHGSALKPKSVPPLSPQQPESRLVYSYGPNNTYHHPTDGTRKAHHNAGWRDFEVQPPGVEVRETADRGSSGLGHVLLGWKVHVLPPPLPCGSQCHLRAQQI